MFDEGPVTGNSEAIFYTTLGLCILTIPGLIIHLKYFLDPEREYETCGTEITAIQLLTGAWVFNMVLFITDFIMLYSLGEGIMYFYFFGHE